MGKRIVTTDEHVLQWAAMVPLLDEREIEEGHERGYITVPVERLDTRIDVLELMCVNCRRSYDQIGDQLVCDAAESNTHLIGGPGAERRKRNHSRHNCQALGCNTTIDEMRRAVGYDPNRG